MRRSNLGYYEDSDTGAFFCFGAFFFGENERRMTSSTYGVSATGAMFRRGAFFRNEPRVAYSPRNTQTTPTDQDVALESALQSDLVTFVFANETNMRQQQ